MTRRSATSAHPDPALAGVPAWPTLDGALAAVAATPLAAVLTAELAPAVGAARQARELVTTGCERWGMPTLADPACIAITETGQQRGGARPDPDDGSAGAPGRPPCTWRFATTPPAARRSPGLSPPTQAGGRGLLLIDTVTRRWGSSAVPDGKVVWCVLHPDDEPHLSGLSPSVPGSAP